MDIRREILGADKILERTVNDVITIVEGKEMARNALPSSAAGISSFKRITTTSVPALYLPSRDVVRQRSAPIARRYSLCSLRAQEDGTPNHTASVSPATEHAAEGARASDHATAACSRHSRKLLPRSPKCRPLLVLHASIAVVAVVDVGDPPTSHPRNHL